LDKEGGATTRQIRRRVIKGFSDALPPAARYAGVLFFVGAEISPSGLQRIATVHCLVETRVGNSLKGKRSRGRRSGTRRHKAGSAYGCFLSDLTRFTADPCIGPDRLPGD